MDPDLSIAGSWVAWLTIGQLQNYGFVAANQPNLLSGAVKLVVLKCLAEIDLVLDSIRLRWQRAEIDHRSELTRKEW